jgi:hypothetical protein
MRPPTPHQAEERAWLLAGEAGGDHGKHPYILQNGLSDTLCVMAGDVVSSERSVHPLNSRLIRKREPKQKKECKKTPKKRVRKARMPSPRGTRITQIFEVYTMLSIRAILKEKNSLQGYPYT